MCIYCNKDCNCDCEEGNIYMDINTEIWYCRKCKCEVD